ncbi:MAG: hypothetical protein ACXAD7_20865 [Candidatus Kariarchaeaceae archaeon]|jgi:hypothetical protein
MTSPIPIRGDFSEDFSTTSNGWIKYSQLNNSHTWEVQDESLVSTGVLDDYDDFNFACHRTDVDTESAIWEFDMWGDEGRWRLAFRISEFPTIREEDGFYRTNMPHFQIVVSAGVDPFGNPSSPEIALVQYHAGTSDFRELTEIIPADSLLRGWHSYQIKRSDDRIKVYIDNSLQLEAELLSHGTAPYDAICMGSEEGSGVKIDNIKARTDDDNGFPILYAFVGLVGIAIVGSLGYVSKIYFKKKA